MPADNLSNWFVQDPSRLQDKIYEIQRVQGRVSALIRKGTLPDGIGYSFQTSIAKRSNATGGSGWIDVAPEDGSFNNCVPAPSTISPANTVLTYGMQQRLVFSVDICLEDVRRAYNYQQQAMTIRDNMVNEIVDIWEDKDKLAFFTNAGHKIVFNDARTESSTVMPATPATYQINQDLLDYIYQRAIQDGAGREPYAQANGAPLLPLIISIEGSRTIIKGSADVRQDFRFADMGKGEGATLLKSWSVDKAYGGFMHIIDAKMPRFNFEGGAWVEVPFYTTQATTIGNESVLNPAYADAEYEDCYVWHPEVVQRKTPAPLGNVGADMTGMAVSFNGDIVWRNIPSKELNPMGNIGFYAAALKAAYEPAKVQYGYVIRYRRCPVIQGEECAY